MLKLILLSVFLALSFPFLERIAMLARSTLHLANEAALTPLHTYGANKYAAHLYYMLGEQMLDESHGLSQIQAQKCKLANSLGWNVTCPVVKMALPGLAHNLFGDGDLKITVTDTGLVCRNAPVGTLSPSTCNSKCKERKLLCYTCTGQDSKDACVGHPADSLTLSPVF